jgi:FtsP/CotA-like multicopper oxidase with cupredoxin domain
MNYFTVNKLGVVTRLFSSALAMMAVLCVGNAYAEVPGITGTTFDLVASADYTSQPDGTMIYSWGFGCAPTTSPSFLPVPATGAQGPAPTCPLMQLPGPTMIVREGDTITVNLKNDLPAAAGNTSMIFPGFNVTASPVDTSATGAKAGLLTTEAPAGGMVSYTFTAGKPGTYSYYSGSQPELQIEMGLFGAIIVLPNTQVSGCATGPFSLAASAYDHAATCYDREYLFQFSEIDSRIHEQAQAQVMACPVGPCPQINVTMEPYRPNYYLINGRSMPDVMDTSYSANYVHQPYNGNPHMHPGERMLMRVIGQGRWQHPFHFHGNHARILARDGNLLLSQLDPGKLAGPLMFTIPTVSGQTVDAIFSWTGKGLNWDVYNHKAGDTSICVADVNGYYTAASGAPLNAPNYGEWCADHTKPIPVTAPDPQIMANGQWYAGTPYLGIQTSNGGFNSTPLPPGTLNMNGGATEAGYAYMWHSHNEREITTNDVFPGGMMMMMLVDPNSWFIDETL